MTHPCVSYVYGDPKPSSTLEEIALGEWLPVKLETLAGSTMRGWLSRLYKYVLPGLGHMPVEEIRRRDVQAWLLTFDSVKQAKVSREVLSSILSFCVLELEVLEANVAFGPYRYPVSSSPNQRPLGHVLTSWDEIFSFIETVRKITPGSNYERGCLSSFIGGLRPSETFGLDCTDIHVNGRRRMSIERAYTAGVVGFNLGPVKTENSYDDVPIIPEVANRFDTLKRSHGPWMRKSDGKRANPHTVARHFKEFKDRHGLPNVTFQTMRHSFATACIRAGVDILDLQGMMRHSSYEMTMHYVKAPHLALEQRTSILEKATVKAVEAVPYERLDADLREIVHALAMDLKSAVLEGFSEAKENSSHEPGNGPLNEPQNNAMLSKNAKLILEVVKHDRKITKAEIAERVGVCDSTVKRAIRELRNAKLIGYEGSSKRGCWTVAA